GSGAGRSPIAPASDRKPPATSGRSRPGPTRPTGRRASSPAANSRKRACPAGCCPPAESCCWTNPPEGSTSAPARRSTGGSPSWRPTGSESSWSPASWPSSSASATACSWCVRATSSTSSTAPPAPRRTCSDPRSPFTTPPRQDEEMAVDSPPRSALAGWRQVPVQELVLPVVIVALLVAGAIIKPDVFPTSDNLLNVLTQASITGIIAIGMTFVIATGGIDLSVGSVLAAASIAGGLLADYGSCTFMLGAPGMALLLGSINGLAITWGKVVPFIATLAMLTIARGLALWMSDKTPISLSQLDILQRVGSGRVLGVPVPALVFLAVTVAGWVLLNRTTFGRHTIAVGGNRSAARIAGIRSNRVIFAVYVLTGLCVGISAILLSGRLASASPGVGKLVAPRAVP